MSYWGDDERFIFHWELEEVSEKKTEGNRRVCCWKKKKCDERMEREKYDTDSCCHRLMSEQYVLGVSGNDACANQGAESQPGAGREK